MAAFQMMITDDDNADKDDKVNGDYGHHNQHNYEKEKRKQNLT